MKKFVFADTKKMNKAEREKLAHVTHDPRLLYRLAYDKCDSVVLEVVKNITTPESVLMAVVDRILDGELSAFGDFVREILGNPNANNRLLEYMTRPENIGPLLINYTWVFDQLDCHPLSDKVYDQLLHAPSDVATAIKMCLVNSAATPKDIIDTLVFDAAPKVREAIAKRDDVSKEHLEILAYDPDPSVRSAVRKNPATPESITLGRLQSLVTSKESWGQEEMDEVLDLVQHPNVPAELLAQVVSRTLECREEDMKFNILFKALSSPKLPAESLQEIADNIDNIHPSTSWRLGDFIRDIVSHQNTSVSTVNELLHYVMPNRSLFTSTISYFAARSTDHTFLSNCLNHRYSSYDDYSHSICRNINAPDDILERVIDSTNEWSQRHKVAVSTLAKKKALAAKAQKSSTPAKPRKASATAWEVSPYDIDTYSDISDELDQAVEGVMKEVAKKAKCAVNYQFDTDSYDDADTLTITTDTGDEYTIDAQRFLARLTSDISKKVGVSKAANFVCKVMGV